MPQPGRVLSQWYGVFHLGESMDESVRSMKDLREVDCDILTLRQYLRPGRKKFSVMRYVFLSEFDALKDIGERMGFKYVVSGPLVRSSYKAGRIFDQLH